MTAPSPAPTGALRFGAFSLDPRSGALHGPHGRASLPDQPLKVLLTLLEQPGELVTREELRQRLWPDNTFVDFEHGLNAAVKRLRDALGDSADSPEYIETLPRRGYRFVGPVEGQVAVADADRPSTLGETLPPASPSTLENHVRLSTGAKVVMAVGLLAAMAGMGLWIAGRRGSGQRVPTQSTLELTRLTFGPGVQTDVTWSPDGQRIAYASDRAGNFDIWVQPVGGGEPTQLTTSPDNDTHPAWAPDGSTIAFRSERDGGGVFLVRALGGAARKLTTFGVHPAWTPDGRDIFIRGGESGFARAYLVSPSGDQPPREILTEFMGGGSWEWMAPHPDGRLSMIGSHRTNGLGFYTVSRDGGDVTVVKPPQALLASLSGEGHHPERRFRWSPRGDGLYIEVADNQIWSLWKVPVEPTTLQWLSAERLTTGADSARSPAISRDGTRIAFASHQTTTRASVFPFDAVAGRLEGEGRPVTDEDTLVLWPSLSRDGRSLLYSVQRIGTDRVDAMSTNLETGETSVLAHNGNQPIESPDRARHAYWLWRRPEGASDPPDKANAREYATALRDRSGAERLVSRWSSQVLMGPSDWTREGDAVIGSYMQTSGMGPVPLVLWRLTGEIPEQPDRVLLHAPGLRFWQPTYSPDWRWISFVAERIDRPDTLEIGVIPADGAPAGGWTRIASDHERPDKPRWAPDGRTMYFLSRKPAGYFNLWGTRMDPERGTPVGEPFQITSFNSPDQMIDPNVSSSEMDVRGRSLLLVTRKTTGNIWMLSGLDR
jgi:Tol biopolymer transport system component/DNA-binding winged helix-turn-helix (wHTH) protein